MTNLRLPGVMFVTALSLVYVAAGVAQEQPPSGDAWAPPPEFWLGSFPWHDVLPPIAFWTLSADERADIFRQTCEDRMADKLPGDVLTFARPGTLRYTRTGDHYLSHVTLERRDVRNTLTRTERVSFTCYGRRRGILHPFYRISGFSWKEPRAALQPQAFIDEVAGER